MSPANHLWIEAPASSAGEHTRSATIEVGGERQALWYTFPDDQVEYLTDLADPFVVGAAYHLMCRGAPVRVHGPVSRSLLRNLVEFQDAWSLWRPGQCHRIEWTADDEVDPPALRDGPALCTFSGGLDACFTAYRHRRGLVGRATIDLEAGLLVHGFDIPLPDTLAFAKARSRAAEMLKSIGMRLLTVRTNFRDLGGHWLDTFGPAAFSCLHWFAQRYSKGVFAANEPYTDLEIPLGSNPITDRLLSSDRFEIVHDAAGYTRNDKAAVVANWPEALRQLRVCWAGEDKSRNCGRCEKCIRTTLNFRLACVSPLPCMPVEVDDASILHLRGLPPILINQFEQILRAAEQARLDAGWVEALRRMIRRNRLGICWRGSVRRQIRSKLIDWLV